MMINMICQYILFKIIDLNEFSRIIFEFISLIGYKFNFKY